MNRKLTTVQIYLGFAVMMVNIIIVINAYYSRQLLKERMENSQRINQQFQKIMELHEEMQDLLKASQKLLKENRELQQQRQQKEKEEEQMEEHARRGLEIKNTDIQLPPGKAEKEIAK